MSAFRSLLAALLCSACSAGCLASTEASDATLELRAGSRGYLFRPGPWIHSFDGKGRALVATVPMTPPTLTDAGARVRVLSSPPVNCPVAGYVTGLSGLVDGRVLLPDEIVAPASLTREGAVSSARNEAAKRGFAAITVDAHAILEYFQIEYEKSYLAVYGRGFLCR